MPVLKYSRQRASIKENLMQRSDHPTADMIYSDIRKIYPHISLGTVYRNLALLSELGEIQKLTASDGAVRFDGNAAPHNHFTCRKCGAVLDLEVDGLGPVKNYVPKNFNGVIEDYSIHFYGLCGTCIKKS